jgi:hypothetical protein
MLMAQMRAYRAAVQRAYPGATVKVVFLIELGTEVLIC